MGITMSKVNKIRDKMEVGDWIDFCVIKEERCIGSRKKKTVVYNVSGYITQKYSNIFYINNTSKSFRWIDYAIWCNR